MAPNQTKAYYLCHAETDFIQRTEHEDHTIQWGSFSCSSKHKYVLTGGYGPTATPSSTPPKPSNQSPPPHSASTPTPNTLIMITFLTQNDSQFIPSRLSSAAFCQLPSNDPICIQYFCGEKEKMATTTTTMKQSKKEGKIVKILEDEMDDNLLMVQQLVGGC